jgi:transcriptional regulator of acetoin/glycerol metabolism
MAAKRIVIAAEKLAEGRFLYEQTFTPMEDIAAKLGISRNTLRKRVKELSWNKRAHDPYAARRMERPAPAASAHQQQAPGYPPAAAERLALVERVQMMVERQIEATETMLPLPKTPDEAERNARALAGLLRTLREMERLQAPPAPPESADDNDMPEDIEELRRELSRKLEALVAGREGAVRSEP